MSFAQRSEEASKSVALWGKNIPVRGNSKGPVGLNLARLRNSKEAIWSELSNQEKDW